MIALNDLILFNNVESTDPLLGALQLPYFKRPTYVYGVSMSNGYEEYLPGRDGRGSQVLLRKLGKGTATVVKANTAGAFDYTFAETADDLIVIPLDNVIKQAEKVYESVEVARASATGARKAEIVLNNLIEEQQNLISARLIAGANESDNTDALTETNIRQVVADDMALALDYVPDTMVVSRQTLATLLKLATKGEYVAYNGFDTIKTGVIGLFMGLNVLVDENLPEGTDYVIYNHQFLAQFNVLEKLTVIPAYEFDGSVIRGLMLEGGYAPVRAKGQGAWAVKHKTA